MAISVTAKSEQALESLPVPGRPRVSAQEVEAPDGFVVEPVLVGLSYANSITFSEDGTLFVCEGGAGWPYRPFVGARILAVEPSGKVSEIAREEDGPLMGIAHHDGSIFASLEGHPTRVVKYDVGTGKREVVVDGIPGGGIHPINAPTIGPDGMVYFSQGAASLNGVPGPTGYIMGVYNKHPNVHDVPGENVTLSGNNLRTNNPGAPFPMPVECGAFKPFGTPAKKGERVSGSNLVTAGLMRANPDGSDVECVAWGIREGFGLAFDERGELFVSDFCMEENGIRPVGNDPGRIWHVKGAKRAPGSIETPDWYGFPDFCGDGLPVTHEKHRPARGPSPELLLEDAPKVADKAVYLNEPHTGMGRMDFCRSDAFGHRGDLFLCQFGSFYPMNTPYGEDKHNGFNVVRIDPGSGNAEVFLRNRQPGPTSTHDRGGGIERPVDCKFSPDGKSLYVLDYGRLDVKETHMTSYAKTGVLWRITPEGEVGA